MILSTSFTDCDPLCTEHGPMMDGNWENVGKDARGFVPT